ncbi:MAG: hypothetical protein KJO07_19550 [Deltaproteobacteria bacterium]|nr:hypothetical protein [Deltaproteobacteria bacterium]
MRARLIVLALLWSSIAAADVPATSKATIELSGIGIEVELPAMPLGTWQHHPRLAAAATWTPAAKHDPAATLAVHRLFLREGLRSIIDLQLYVTTLDCEGQLHSKRPAGATRQRGQLAGGWLIDRYSGPQKQAVACRRVGHGQIAVAVIRWGSGSSSSFGLTGDRSPGGSHIDALLVAVGAGFDDRVRPSRPLVEDSMRSEAAQLRLPLSTSEGLVLDPGKTGQLLASEPTANRFIRVMPAFPEVSFDPKVRTAVPGDKSCGALLELVQRKNPGAKLVDVAVLPKAYQFRKIIKDGRLVVVCEDFTGGVQLSIAMVARAAPEIALTSMEPILAALHDGVRRKYGVEAKTIAKASSAGTGGSTAGSRASRRRSQRARGRMISGVQLAVANVDGGEIPDAGLATALSYLFHMRFGGEPVGFMGHIELETGFGTDGGLVYGTYLEPYGFALGTSDYYLGLAPGVGLSGWTGGRLNFGWHAGVLASAAANLGPVQLLAGVRAIAVTGDERQNGSESAPFGDELEAQLDLMYTSGRGTTWGLGAVYKEARGSTFVGGVLTFGYAAR